MKKTIAILLVLVIGMVGVWAANALPTGDAAATGTASIVIDTTVDAFAYFGLTEPDAAVPDHNSSGEFVGDILDLIEYTSTDFELTDFATAQPLAKLWGLNNTTSAINISITSTDGFVGADNTTKIPLTFSIDSATITAASGTTLGFIDYANDANLITAIASTPAQVYTATAQTYEATIVIAIITT